MPSLFPLLVVLASSLVAMTGLWALHLRLRNAALVDVGWSGLLGLSGVALAIAGEGDVGRRVLVGALVGAWSLRLTTHLLRERILGQEEEGRYQRLRAYWGRRAWIYFLPFFLGQAVLVALLSVPFWLAASSTAAFPAVFDVLGVVLVLVGLSGETLADRQLARFRADPDNRGGLCREGLWRYSRHPNYFFEWVTWCGLALPALSASGGWIALFAPALMLLFVTKVTGIPPTELQLLKTRGDAYGRYQATTSAFVPWPPRKEAVR